MNSEKIFRIDDSIKHGVQSATFKQLIVSNGRNGNLLGLDVKILKKKQLGILL